MRSFTPCFQSWRQSVWKMCKCNAKTQIKQVFEQCFDFFCIMLVVPRFLWQNKVTKSDPLERDAWVQRKCENHVSFIFSRDYLQRDNSFEYFCGMNYLYKRDYSEAWNIPCHFFLDVTAFFYCWSSITQ